MNSASLILKPHLSVLLRAWPALGCVLVAFVPLGPRQVGAGHGGERVGADARVLTLWRRHGHDRLSQAAAHWVCGRKTQHVGVCNFIQCAADLSCVSSYLQGRWWWRTVGCHYTRTALSLRMRTGWNCRSRESLRTKVTQQNIVKTTDWDFNRDEFSS